ncbi:MAG: riboflavin synthase [Acidimicrobiia bacterium]
MFTGIVAEIGSIAGVAEAGRSRRLSILAPQTQVGLSVGDSVAVNGVCLTVVSMGPTLFDLEAVPETLERTNLGGLRPGAPINVERPVAAAGRFDGHLVQGHVDGVASVRSLRSDDESSRLWFDLATEHHRYIVRKGSIALDGVSLTVSGVDDSGFEVVLIPHTLQVTTMGALAVGDQVNVEVDVLAKYVERLLEAHK